MIQRNPQVSPLISCWLPGLQRGFCIQSSLVLFPFLQGPSLPFLLQPLSSTTLGRPLRFGLLDSPFFVFFLCLFIGLLLSSFFNSRWLSLSLALASLVHSRLFYFDSPLLLSLLLSLFLSKHLFLRLSASSKAFLSPCPLFRRSIPSSSFHSILPS